jgi:hypothetical protein
LYGELDLNGNKIIGVANGVNPSDAVNKSQLDAVVGGTGDEIEVTIDINEPTPVVGMDIWIDPDAPDWVGGVGGVGGPSSNPPPAVGPTSVTGVDTDYAREDHTHAGAAVSHSHLVGDLPTSLATDAEVTSAVSAHNSGSNHVALSSTTPAALGAAGNVGVGTTSARADHVHIYPTAANVGAAAASHTHVEGDLPAAMATEAEVATAIGTHNSGSPHVALTANLPVALGAAAVGSGTTSARDNHVHPTTGLSLTGHSHVEGDLPSTLATDAEVTSAVSTHNSGSPHVALTANTPAALGVAAVGNGTASARDNHVHAMPSAAQVGAAATSHSHVEGDLPSTLATDTEVSTAVSNHLSGANHVALSSTTPAPLAAAGTVGVGTTSARADHVHIRPTPADIGAAATVHTHVAGDVTSGTFGIGLIPTGTSGTTVALGNHTHTQAQSHGTPDTDSGTTSLHHTIGTSATQAAAGNHSHATPTIDHGATTGLNDDDHTQYGLVVISATQPVAPRVGTIWVPSG